MSDDVKSVLKRSRFAQCAYGAWKYVRGRYYFKTNRLYRALNHFCEAYRQIPMPYVKRTHVAAIHSTLRVACYSGDQLNRLGRNQFLIEYPEMPEACRLRKESADRTIADRVRLRLPKPDPDPKRQGNLIILKWPDPRTGERGVLLLKYLYTFAEMPAVFDLQRIAERYQIVLEPSWTGYVEAPFFLYIGSDLDVVIQCTQPQDAQFFEKLGVNFRTVPLGGGDWVDYDLFKPNDQDPRDFDLAMVASWTPWKRHHALFRALAKLKPRQFRVALIGAGDAQGRQVLENEMRAFGVRDQCQIFERVSPREVAAILARSKVSLLLSKLEGTNKGIYEALFCDTPIIVYRHHAGLNMSTVNEWTGTLADDDELPTTITRMVDADNQFRPRQWALANTGYRRSTETVNSKLREMALNRGEPWTRDIVFKVNRPHAQYKFEEDRIALSPAYDELAESLR